MERKQEVSKAVIQRLPRYYRNICELKAEGEQRISSKALAERMGLTASQIRQDFNCFGGFGQQGYGYNVEELRAEIARYLDRRMGLKYDPAKEVLVTVGGSEAIDMCIRALVNPGDEVLIPQTCFVCYEPMVQMAQGVPVIIETKEENSFRLTPEELRPIALSYLKPKRMPHVLGTEQEAVRLARQYGADETQARVAALLHDCTKKLDMERQLALCAQYHIRLDDLERHALKLLHAKTGAAIARDVFGVDDAVYWAIYWHTTGHADMTLLEKIIYLADYIEPSRDFPGVEVLRKCVYEDLDRGLLMGLEMTVQEMTEMGNPVHHATIEARDWLKGKR